MKFSRKRRQFFIFLIDALILLADIYLALLIRNFSLPSYNYVLQHLKYFWTFILTYAVCAYTESLYSLNKDFSFRNVAAKILLAVLPSMLVCFSFFYLFPSNNIRPQTVLVVYAGLAFITILLWRILYERFFRLVKRNSNYILFGYTPLLVELIKNNGGGGQRNYLNFLSVALFSSQNAIEVNCKMMNLPYISSIDKLRDIVDSNKVNTFVLTQSEPLPADITQFLFGKIKDNAQFYYFPEFYEMLERKIPVGTINDQWVLQNISLDGRFFYRMLKRFFDIVFSFVLILLTVWFWPVVALIIKLESQGPVFFTQIREGKDGKIFKLLKFRTMRTEQNNFSPTEKDDSRVTAFGNIMRKTRIDELPQLLNVLKGDMSLIGPRPERPELAFELEKDIPFYRQRLLVKPGITGWDQVSGEYHSPSKEDTYKKIQNDLYYVKNQSVFLDASIFFKTIVTVLKRAGR